MAAGAELPVHESIKDDDRDVSDLWNEALKSYHGITGLTLERKFDNVDAMINFGVGEMNNFHKFRHDDKKVDKLRTLFAANMGYIEAGTQQLIAAATPAFPPAAVIGTAITYMLSACRQVSADYDIVVVFFEDMNAFLQRIVILESRTPKYKAFQNCLMDVFTSMLSMCGFAQKYIVLGRFKKWIQNLMFGQDSELGGARKTMDTSLSRLQNATEFAILGNTEDAKKMGLELKKNSDSHTELLRRQSEMLGSIQDDTEHIRNDMGKLLEAFRDQKKERSKDQKKSHATEQGKPPSAKRIRNSLPEVESEIDEYHILKETLVESTGTWIFGEQQWKDWISIKDSEPRPVLAITGEPGMGKSHLAASVFDKLREKASQDDAKHACAAHFYFREQHLSLSSFHSAIITVINQVVEQNAALCEKINAEFTKDEVDVNVWEWKDLVKMLLAPCFQMGSKYRLDLVFDGVDELDDLQDFKDFLSTIKEQNLQIYIVITARSSILPAVSETAQVVSLEVTKEKQIQDFKAIIWNGINTLSSLRRFGRYVKQTIADKVEETSPSMLYAERLLAKFNAQDREGAVLRSLNKPLPPTLHDLFETILEGCHRRTIPAHQEPVKFLLHIAAYSFRALTFSEVTSLMRQLTGDNDFDVDEIPEPFAQFLRVGDPGADAEARAKLQSRGGYQTAVQDLEKNSSGSPERIYNDGMLPVKFQERSLRSFFSDKSTTNTTFHWSPSEAHRRIFLATAKFARPVPHGSAARLDSKFQGYATHFTLQHWREINPEEHTPEEQAEVMEALWVLLTNQHGFAVMTEWNEAQYAVIFGPEGFEKIPSWTSLPAVVEGTNLSEGAVEWWRGLSHDHKQALIPIAKAHLQRLYAATELSKAITAFDSLRSALEGSKLTSIITDEGAETFPEASAAAQTKNPWVTNKAAVLGVPNLFGLEMNGPAYLAVAELLLHFNQRKPAEVMCRKALEHLAEDAVAERFRARVLLAGILSKLGRVKLAHETVVLYLEQLNSENIPAAYKRSAYVTKARIEVKRGEEEAACQSFADARAADPSKLTPGDVLEEEYVVMEEYEASIAILRKWSPLERLTWMAWDYDDSGDDRHERLLDATVFTGEITFVTEIYEEAIKWLDNVGAGAPLRYWLAKFHKEVSGDLEAARKMFDEILDSGSTGWPYAVTDESPDYTLQNGLSAQSDILFSLFSSSSDPAVKRDLLEAAKGLVTRPLGLDVPPESDTWIIYYRLNVARMHLKMGPAVEFQRLLQEVIDSCVEALSDKVGWNDTENLICLAKALLILSKAVPDGEELRRTSEIFSSARFSRLSSSPKTDDEGDEEEEDEDEDEDEEDEDEEDEEEGDDGENGEEKEEGEGEEESESDSDEEPPTDEGDLADESWSCAGSCDSDSLSWWGKRIMYQCYTCDTFLCEACHEARIASDRDGVALTGRSYCGKNHEHVKAPMAGWKGIKDGKVQIEGQEGQDFEELLQKVKNELCKKAWEDFWRGG